jgi:hypothetical protein
MKFSFICRPAWALGLILAATAAVLAAALNQLTDAENAAGWEMLFMCSSRP